MFRLMCVTNRSLCETDFLPRLEDIAKNSSTEALAGIILREKDMSPEEYKSIAKNVMQICRQYNTPCILHNFVDVAKELNAPAIHLPLHILRNMSDFDKKHFTIIGASCHSVDEAMTAEALGCHYITAGHIFTTDCKKGLEPRGLEFLENVCASVNIPVYAIGGINHTNISLVKDAGATGACIMSGFMRCDAVEEYISKFNL